MPAELEQLILQCLAKDRDDRPDSADELDQTLSTLETAYDGTDDKTSSWWATYRATTNQ